MMSSRSVLCALLVLFGSFSSRVSAKRNIPGFTSIINVNITNQWLWPEDDSPVFYKHFYQKVTWQEAQSVCEYNRAKLVTVETSVQYDQVRAYLKELDVNNLVWIGLKKEASHFVWQDAKPLEGEGYWLESPPKEEQPLCAALDPWKDYRWKTFNCAGPEMATFICELPIPEWADHGFTGCMLDSLPSLTITYHPEDESVHLLHDCGLDGSRTVACKGTADKRDLMMLLHCNQNISTWYKGMWDSAISNRHRRSSSFPAEFTTPTHYVYANDFFDYEDGSSKTTADSKVVDDKAIEDNVITPIKGDTADLKGDIPASQDFMVGFAPEDLSFADEPIKALPLDNVPSIPDSDFEKPTVDGSIVYNSSTTETLSKLTVGTETQLVRSVNNTNNFVKTETSTPSLAPSSTTTIQTTTKGDTKGLKEMLLSGIEDTVKTVKNTAEKSKTVVEAAVEEFQSTLNNTKAKIENSLKTSSERTDKLKTISKESEEIKDDFLNKKSAVKRVVGESKSIMQNKEKSILGKLDTDKSIDKTIDFMREKSDSNKHSENYVKGGVQNLIDITPKKGFTSKTSMKENPRIKDVITSNIPLVPTTEKSTQNKFVNMTKNIIEKLETKASTAPEIRIPSTVEDVWPDISGHVLTSNEPMTNSNDVTKMLNKTSDNIASTISSSLSSTSKEDVSKTPKSNLEKVTEPVSLDVVDVSNFMNTMYNKYKDKIMEKEKENRNSTEIPLKNILSSTQKSEESTIKLFSKKNDVQSSTPVAPAIEKDLTHVVPKKHQDASPSLVILDSKGHSLNSNQFALNEDDSIDTDFFRTTENNLDTDPLFGNEIVISKKNIVASHKNATINNNRTVENQSTSRAQGSATTAKYERRNLPPVLMIDKVEQLNEAAGMAKSEATFTLMLAESTTTRSEATPPTTTVRTESQTIKKPLPAILGNQKPRTPTSTKTSPTTTSMASSTLTPATTTKKSIVEPVPDMPEKPKRSPLFSPSQHRSHYPYFLGRILG
uniref:C-type lectin domain-containing protein n=1 Tax=Cacopsylla melanoneura TaxID=428564 RepID=A0A8D8SYA1_9HEMI